MGEDRCKYRFLCKLIGCEAQGGGGGGKTIKLFAVYIYALQLLTILYVNLKGVETKKKKLIIRYVLV